MKHLSILFVAGALALAAGCDGAPTAPRSSAPTAGAAAPVTTIYDASTKTLGVSVYEANGYNKFTTAADYTLATNVTGGTPPYKRYYYVERCSSSTLCHGLNLYSATDGSSETLTFYVFPEDAFIRVKVTVGDASGESWTGHTSKHFIGPSAISSTAPTVSCYGGDDPSIGFPFTQAIPPDPINQTGKFRYNACTMTRVWEPK